LPETFCLFIDVGNTNIKFALAGSRGLRPGLELPTDTKETADSLGLKILDYLRLENTSSREVANWLMASVVPVLNPKIVQAGIRFCRAHVYHVPGDLPVSINNQYLTPQEVGADRLVNALGARRTFHQQGLVIVDFGTATTFDCVVENDFIGGLICPGIYSSIQALSTRTAKLPWFNLEEAGDNLEIGRSTAQSLAQGTRFGFAAMVEGLLSRLKHMMPQETLVVATGGFAEIMAPACPGIDEVQLDLLMQGLMFTAKEHAIFNHKE